MKKSKFFKTLLVIFLFAGFLFISFNEINIMKVKADSGFDSSFSGGSESSWGNSDYGSSGYSSASDFVGVAIIIIVIILISKSNGITKVTTTAMLLDHNKELTDDKINKFIPNFEKEKFLNDRYLDYLEIQRS